MRVLTAVSAALAAALVATCAPALASPPEAEVRPGQAYVFPSSVEFDWNVRNAAEGTRVTIVYVGCGGKVAGYGSVTGAGDYGLTVHGNPSKLGPDWTRTVVVEQQGADTYTDTETNTDSSLQFTCSKKEEPIVEKWSRKEGKVKSNPRPGDRLAVSRTRLNSFGEAKAATVSYRWTVDGKPVSTSPRVRVQQAWAGRTVRISVLAATEQNVWQQSRTLRFGTVRGRTVNTPQQPGGEGGQR